MAEARLTHHRSILAASALAVLAALSSPGAPSIGKLVAFVIPTIRTVVGGAATTDSDIDLVPDRLAVAVGPLLPVEQRGREPVTFAFGGDIHFEGFLRPLLLDDPAALLAPIGSMMADADIAVANLETAITDRGTPAPKRFVFRADPVAFDALESAGIDVVSVANNHGMDFGPVGLTDTVAAAAEAGFSIVGGGSDAAQAYAPWTTSVRGTRVAVIGATQVLDGNLIASWTATDQQPGLASAKEQERLAEAVRQAAADHHIVVVFLHWGIEGQTCPAPRQQELSDLLVGAGARIVVGGHAHRVQGGGLKDGAFVHYGLGNFVFYTPSGPGTESGVLRVTADSSGILDYRWVPARLRSGVATRTDDPADVDRWDALRDCTDLTK